MRYQFRNKIDLLADGSDIGISIIGISSIDKKVHLALDPVLQRRLFWDDYLSQVNLHDVVEGKVLRRMEFGYFIELAPGVDGLLPIKYLRQGVSIELNQVISVKII